MRYAAQDRRAQPRNFTHVWANLRRHGESGGENVVLVDLSLDGFKMRSPALVSSGDTLVIELLSGLNAEVRVVRADLDSGEYGCRFLYRLPPAILHRVFERAGAGSQAGVDETVRQVRAASRHS